MRKPKKSKSRTKLDYTKTAKALQNPTNAEVER